METTVGTEKANLENPGLAFLNALAKQLN